MSEYQYPDKDDKLTAALINNEYDGLSWQKSEEKVMSVAVAAVSGLSTGRHHRTLLDVGCGIGRMFGVFAEHVGRIDALEPDRDRADKAHSQGRRIEERTGTKISVINGTIGSIAKDTKYDVVLSSHVIQHLGSRQAEELVRAMSDRLCTDGLLILTTTYACDGQERFYSESWDGKVRKSVRITPEDFERVYRDGTDLPVRMFAEETITKMAETASLRLVAFRPFHGKIDGQRTEHEHQPRDAFYLFVKVQENKSVKEVGR